MDHLVLVLLALAALPACGRDPEVHVIAHHPAFGIDLEMNVCATPMETDVFAGGPSRGDSGFKRFEHEHCSFRSVVARGTGVLPIVLQMEGAFPGAGICGVRVGPGRVDAPLPFGSIVRQLDPFVGDRIFDETRISNNEPAIAFATQIDGIDVWFAQLGTPEGVIAELDIDGCGSASTHAIEGTTLVPTDRDGMAAPVEGSP